jgi:hypothetical protein
MLPGDGHILRAIEIDCADDGAAAEQAKLLVEGNVARANANGSSASSTEN